MIYKRKNNNGFSYCPVKIGHNFIHVTKESKGLLWSAIDRFSVQSISFILSIIIARLVSPSAYGVMVMVQVFLSFAQLFIDGGFKSALIQKKNRTEIDYYTVFNFNLVIAIFIYIIIFISSPYIANFYNEPQLTSLTRVIAFNLILSSLSIIQLVRLQVILDYKTQAKSRIISVLISGTIGIICAYYKFEVWALVIQGLLNTLISSFLLIFFSRWIPRLQFSWNSFKGLFTLGSKILFGNFLTNCYIQVTNLIIGKIYNSSQLAYYNRAFTLSMIPSTSLTEVILRTIYPIYCNLQDNRTELIRKYNQYTRLSCLIIFPLLGLIGALSKPLIVIILTEKWLETAPLLSIFCLVFVPYPIFCNADNIISAMGKGNIIAKSTLLKRIIALGILISTIFISVKAVAIGLVFSNICELLISMLYVRKVMNYSIYKQFSIFAKILFITALSSLLAWIVSSIFTNYFFQLITGFIIGFSSYLFLIFLFKIEERKYILKFINKYIKIRF